MAKLYFKYGAMGSSKSAQALIAKYNYEERGMKVWLIKPMTDTRDGANIIKSRIGLSAVAEEISSADNIKERFSCHRDCDVIIGDECQFFTPQQIAGMIEKVSREEIIVAAACVTEDTVFILESEKEGETDD